MDDYKDDGHINGVNDGRGDNASLEEIVRIWMDRRERNYPEQIGAKKELPDKNPVPRSFK
ncbi:hypothetical protein HAX54_045760, partial [Datura stramonium]|nr:hypothetical protein [Datura stramonium]